MVLRHLTQNIGCVETQAIVPQTPSSQTQTANRKIKRRHLFCFLLLANIIAWNAIYGAFTAEKGKPIWDIVTTDNLICKLWKKYPLLSKSTLSGMVSGILFDEANPAALIDNKLVHEGDTIADVKIVQINARRVQFEKKGRIWTQGVGQKPNSIW